MASLPRALVTGAAGFIGSHVAERLLKTGWRVTAIDNFDPFYDPEIKRQNLRRCQENPEFDLFTLDIRSRLELENALQGRFDLVIHIAAKAGVRPSIADPIGYSDVNINGTQVLLEICRTHGIPRFIFASSSSVYGINEHVPWSEEDHVLLPISPYAATKVSGELLGHVYSRLYGIQFLALRFFTVYGPRQRPDLAIHRFSHLMLEGKPLPLYGDGSTRRDYTYIDDIVDGIMGAVSYDSSAYEIINLGHSRTISLSELVQYLEDVFKIRAKIERLPAQPGDVPTTWADTAKAERLLGYQPRVPFVEGLERFADWIVGAHGICSK